MSDRTDIWLAVITVILLLIFWSILLYYSSLSIPPSPPNTDGNTYAVRTPSNNPYLQDCPKGYCATNLFNGEKRCSDTTDGIVQANITLEVCNPREKCTTGTLPYAILSDGSTNIEGICDPGIACRCTNNASCANYIGTYFQTFGGNPYVSTNGQRTRFRQDIMSSDGLLPSNFNPETTFCRIPIDWLPRSAPGCNFVDASPQNITECMDPELSNPCLVGTLAFITPTSEFSVADINRIPLACVKGKSCPSGYINIYDTDFNGIVCEKIV